MSTGKKREGKHTWAHNWFCSAHKCLFVSDTGEVCGLIRNARNCVDRALHLKTHGVTHTTTLPTGCVGRSKHSAGIGRRVSAAVP
jgi:hypothetical protein